MFCVLRARAGRCPPGPDAWGTRVAAISTVARLLWPGRLLVCLWFLGLSESGGHHGGQGRSR